MFNQIMEEIRMLSMGSTTNHLGFHIDGVPQLSEHGDSIGQTKKNVMMYARGIDHE